MTTATVKASGGDYTSFVTAEATEQKTLGSGEIFYIEGYKGSYSGGGTNYIQENLTVAGWGGLAANAYVHVRAAAGESMTGIPLDGSGNYTGIGLRNNSSIGGNKIITNSQNYTRITDLILGNYISVLYGVINGISSESTYTDVYAERNVCVAGRTTSDCGSAIEIRPHLYSAGGNIGYVRDNLIISSDGGTSNHWADGLELKGNVEARNNTIVDANTGILGVTVTGSSPVVKNNIVQSASTACFSGSFATEDYNIADDTSTTGGNSQNSLTIAFNDPSNHDYSLNSSDTNADDEGLGPSSDSVVNTSDIIGTSRSGTTCSVGAFEYVGGATTKTKTASLDALLKKANNLKTTSLDALLQKTQTLQASLDSLLIQTLTKTTSLDAALRAIGTTKTTSIDALLSQLGLTKTASLDAVLISASSNTITTSLDALLSKSGIVKTTNIDALLQKTLTKTTSLDSLLQKTINITTTVDALLKQTLTKTTGLDAVLIGAGTNTIATSLDALLKKTLNLTLSVDALIRKNNNLLTASIDSVVIKRGLLTSQLDAILRKNGISLTISIDSVLQALNIPGETFGINSLIFATKGIDSLISSTKGIDSAVTITLGINSTI